MTTGQSAKPDRPGQPHVALGTGQKWGLRLAGAAGALGVIDAYGLLRRRLVRWSACILSYHRVGPDTELPTDVPLTTPADFEQQVLYLKRHYQVMSLAAMGRSIRAGEALPRNAAAITFDDGYRDNYRHAYPILKKHGVPATIFLATAHVDEGHAFWWDRVSYAVLLTSARKLESDRLGSYDLSTTPGRWEAVSIMDVRLKQMRDHEKNEAIEEMVRKLGADVPATMARDMILTWNDVREMAANGITFGSHTVHHPTLIGLPLEQARQEIVDSRSRIEEKTGQPCDTFAYPDGREGNVSPAIKSILAESGYVCAVYALPNRLVAPGADPYGLARVSPKWDFTTFRLSVSGLYPDLASVINRRRTG